MVISSREMHRRLIQTKVYYKLFQSVWKEASHKTLKVAAAEKSFPSVFIIDTTCFDECFLFYVITRNNIFLHKFIVTQRLGTTAMLQRSLKQVFWKKSAFDVRYLDNNITMMLIPRVQNKAFHSHFVNVPHFSL